MKRYGLIGLLVLAVILAGCRKSKPVHEGSIPVIHKIAFAPYPPMEGKDLLVKADLESDPKDGRVEISYKWYRDGELLKDYTGNTLPGSEVADGVEIYAEVKAANPLKESAWVKSEKVTVGQLGFHFNNVWIEPENPKKSDVLQANYDCDNCRGMRFSYRWLVNDKKVEGADQPELNGTEAGLKPGDQVVAEIATEQDPDNFHGSAPVKVVVRDLVFTDNGKLWVDNNTVYFQFRAQDPDGGAVTYELVQSPQGASLNAGAGQVSWPVPQGFTGTVEFKVKAKNSAGKEIFLSGGFQVREQKSNPEP